MDKQEEKQLEWQIEGQAGGRAGGKIEEQTGGRAGGKIEEQTEGKIEGAMEGAREGQRQIDKHRIIRVVVIVGFLLLVVGLVKMITGQRISSVEDLQAYLRRFGMAGPIVLTLFQAFQVVVPVVPGYLGCAAGAISFGTTIGFLCNYIGISAGSIIAYFLARKYGMEIVLLMFSEKQYAHWSKKVSEHKSYDTFLFLATLLPLFPDDFLCYFSGLIRMNAKRFIWIIILGKPWCILAYSIVFGLIK